MRHESWAVPDFYDELAERGIGFVNIDQPLFQQLDQAERDGDGAGGYVRIHGRNYREWFRKDAGVEARYDYLYSPAELTPWAERSVQVAESGRGRRLRGREQSLPREGGGERDSAARAWCATSRFPRRSRCTRRTRTSWRRGRTRLNGRTRTRELRRRPRTADARFAQLTSNRNELAS